MHIRSLALAALIVIPTSGFTQPAPLDVPIDMHIGLPRADNNSITYCVDDRLAGAEVDVEIATAIAVALFLEPRFYRMSEMPGRVNDFYGIPDNLLFILLDDECDAFIGMPLGDSVTVPDFTTVTQPYYQTRYVIASTNPVVRSFADLATSETKVGIPILSRMNSTVSFYAPTTSRRVYDDEPQLFEAIRAGEIAAGIFLAPQLLGLTSGDPAEFGLTLSRIDPMPNGEVPVAMLLMSELTYTRTLLDQAIAALTADGTIGRILSAAGFDQVP